MKKNKCTVFKGTGKAALRARSKLPAKTQPTNHRDQKASSAPLVSVVRPIPDSKLTATRRQQRSHFGAAEVPKSLIVMGLRRSRR